jgi:hypothetical protein
MYIDMCNLYLLTERAPSPGMWHCVVWWKFTNVLENCTALRSESECKPRKETGEPANGGCTFLHMWVYMYQTTCHNPECSTLHSHHENLKCGITAGYPFVFQKLISSAWCFLICCYHDISLMFLCIFKTNLSLWLYIAFSFIIYCDMTPESQSDPLLDSASLSRGFDTQYSWNYWRSISMITGYSMVAMELHTFLTQCIHEQQWWNPWRRWLLSGSHEVIKGGQARPGRIN